jgi:Holliday junction resolvase RusA-like endonuclease
MRTERRFELQVLGVPQPAGSKKAFPHSKTGRIMIVDDAKLSRPWKQEVAHAARARLYGEKPIIGPIAVQVWFYMPRPKGHYGTGANADKLRAKAPKHHTVRPDTSKLWRCVEDALTTAGVWRDDAQVVDQSVRKMYADEAEAAGTFIRVEELP